MLSVGLETYLNYIEASIISTLNSALNIVVIILRSVKRSQYLGALFK